MLQQNSETQQLNRELEMKLKAQELRFKMFARTQNVPQEDLDSIILAAELEEEQHRDAQGEVLETAPSSSSGPPGPVIITTTKHHPPKGDETLKSS